ncbi:hypothetical protein HC928_24910, partial [bacterium]|nr:hypothetical protein [bacterium]
SRASEPTQQSLRPVRFPAAARQTRPRSPVPITLAAVMTAALIVGGLLIFTLSRRPAAEIETASSNSAAADAVALRPSPTPSPTRTRIVNTPTNTVTLSSTCYRQRHHSPACCRAEPAAVVG